MLNRHENRLAAVAAIVAVVSTPAAVCLAQASFLEDFESIGTVASGEHGPSGLIADGWIFRNQSDPESSGDWHRSVAAYQGTWGLSIDWSVGWWDGAQAEESSWAVPPQISDQVAGDMVRFFYFNTQAPPLVPAGRLEVRYSPSGGTGTGSGPDDVGDFTVLLSDIPAFDDQWTEHMVELPGSGRIALRFHIPPVASQQEFWAFFDIDNLSVGPPGPPCNQPPVPGPGETVTWTAAVGPHEVCENLTVPADSTVLVEAGAVVNVQATTTITLWGTMIFQGTAAAPVVLTAETGYPPMIENHGALEMNYVELGGGQVRLWGGDLLMSNCTYVAPGLIFGDGKYVQIDGCLFNDSPLYAGADTMVVRNSDFENTYVAVNGMLLFLDGVTVDNSPVDGISITGTVQALFLDNVSVTNSAGAGLKLVAGNFLIDGSVGLQGNLYPVQMGGCGILPGSVVPAAGNVNNHILVESAGAAASSMVWTDAGVPYVIEDVSYIGGTLRIDPGVNIKLGPNTTFWGELGFVDARGLPGAPVVFERLDPAQSWQGLQYFHRFENCIIDGGQIGARFHSSTYAGFIDNCVIQNCDFGTQNDVVVRKTRLLNNTTASWGDNWPNALNGATGANSFEGNGVAVDSTGLLIDARNNWWGDPSGPTAPDNPGGAGDTILGAGVAYEPFLTAPPDFADNPPIVKLNRNSSLLEPGSKVIVSWDSQDGGAVVAHRLDFDHPLEGVSVVAELPGSQHAFEWTVPDIGFAVNGKAPVLRVTAIDSAGQEGWDEQFYLIPTGDVQGTLTITTDLAGPFVAGEAIGQLCWTAEGTNPLGYVVSAALYFDGDDNTIGLGGVTSYLDCLSGTLRAPQVSTDTARISLRIEESLNNVKYFFSDYFAVRPDSRLGDSAPAVQLLTPTDGEEFPGGSVVPITWTASDDEGLRSFDVQASYDGGHTWHFIATDLPGTATAFNWPLPSSSDIADVRVRVMARDLRFQTASDGAANSFAITSGDRALGDIDGDGDVDLNDWALFAECMTGPGSGLAAGCETADLDSDGDADLADFGSLQEAF